MSTLISVFLEIEIKPKARARKGVKGFYSPCRKEEKNLAWAILAAVKAEYPNLKLPLTGDLGIIICVQGKSLRGDWDNYGKMVCDACQKAGIVENDRQFRCGSVRLFCSETPELFISIMPADDCFEM